MVQDICSSALPSRGSWLLLFFATGTILLLAFAPPRANALQASSVPTTESQPSQPAFEVAAIKPSKTGDGNHNWNDTPGRVSIENYTLRRLISVAFGLKSESQVLGGPAWIGKEAFDIQAKIDDADATQMRKMNRTDRNQKRERMIQSLLADRFGLKISQSERELPVFALVVTKSGTKITPSPEQNNRGSEFSGHDGRIIAMHISMDEFAHDLGVFDEIGNRVVLNQTGLTGDFDFKMNFARDHGDGIPDDAQDPGLFTALKEQLGLELKLEKASIPVIVVESASEPAYD